MLSDLAILAFQLFIGITVWSLFVGIGAFVVFSLFTRSLGEIIFSLFMFSYVMAPMIIVTSAVHGGHLELWLADTQVLLVQVITEGPLTFHILSYGITDFCMSTKCITSREMMMGTPLILRGTDILLYFALTGLVIVWSSFDGPAWNFSMQLNHAARERRDREKFGPQGPITRRRNA